MPIMKLNRPLNLLRLKLQAYFNVMTWRHAATGISGVSLSPRLKLTSRQCRDRVNRGGKKLVKMSCTIRLLLNDQTRP